MLFLVLTLAFVLYSAVSAKTDNVNADNKKIQALRLLAKQMDTPSISEAQEKNIFNRLASLNRDESLLLKRLWRAELVAKGVISHAESAGFSTLEKIEIIFSEKIAELFGENATIFNISSDDFALVEKALSDDATLINLMYSAEDAFKAETSASTRAQLIVAASSCYYDNNWPKWLSATSYSGTVYKGGGVGRVKNDPNEWPCDFVIYIPANRYTKVTGLNSAARSVVNYSGGLSASPTKDAVIVGYGRVLRYGIPTEDWVRNSSALKSKSKTNEKHEQ